MNVALQGVLLALILLFSTAGSGDAASALEIDAKAEATLKTFYSKIDAARELTDEASGVLIFPEVYKAGFGIGGQYGEGVLRISGQSSAYYSTASASIGFQLGAQKRSIILLFMTRQALQQFRQSKGWEIGVDGSVALIEFGVGKEFDSTNIKEPVIGFVFGNKGLMYNLSLEGTKISRIER